MSNGLLTISSVSGSGPYTVQLASTTGITAGDHFGARITSAAGPGGLWAVDSVDSGVQITITDTLTEENGGAFGIPIAGDAWYGTPTAQGLSRKPHRAVAWDAAGRRNAYLVNPTSIGAVSTASQNANLVFSGPASGGPATPTFRSLVSDDLPTVPVAKGGTNATTASDARTNLGLAIGSDVQAYSSILAALAALTLAGNGTEAVAVKSDETGFETVAVSGLTTEFEDDVFRVKDEGDTTKKVAFDLSGVTTATTRTLTVPDASGTIALTSDLPDDEFPDNTFRIQDNGDATKEVAFECSGITAGTTRTLTVPDKSGTIALVGYGEIGTSTGASQSKTVPTKTSGDALLVWVAHDTTANITIELGGVDIIPGFSNTFAGPGIFLLVIAVTGNTTATVSWMAVDDVGGNQAGVDLVTGLDFTGNQTLKAAVDTGDLNVCGVGDVFGGGGGGGGGGIGGWTTAATQTGSWSTNTTYAASYRREGNMARVRVKMTFSGAPDAATNLALDPPDSLVFDTLTPSSFILGGPGRGLIDDTGNLAYPIECLVIGQEVRAYAITTSGTYASLSGSTRVTNTLPVTIGNGDTIDIEYLAPIVGW